MANMRRTATWKNVGADVSKCRTIEEVLKTSGLDYTVVKRQAYDRFGGRYRKLKGQYYAFRGTAWGLINAYTDCLTRKPLLGTATEETRFVNVTIKNDKSRNVFNTTPSGFLTMVNDIAVA